MHRHDHFKNGIYTEFICSVLTLYMHYAARTKVLRITSLPPFHVTVYKQTQKSVVHVYEFK